MTVKCGTESALLAAIAARFPKGCRVRGTARFLSQFQTSPARPATGTVVGRCRAPNCINVRRDGHVTHSTYSVDHWEPIPEPMIELGAYI